MKIYKNPFVSRESYFLALGPAKSARMESAKTRGYIIEEIGGKWDIRYGEFYNMSLENELPVVANISEARLKGAVINLVLAAVWTREDINDG